MIRPGKFIGCILIVVGSAIGARTRAVAAGHSPGHAGPGAIPGGLGGPPVAIDAVGADVELAGA